MRYDKMVVAESSLDGAGTSCIIDDGAGPFRPSSPEGTSDMNAENLRSGWIRVYRSIIDHPVFTQHPPEYLKVWLYMLAKANAKPRVWWNGSEEVSIPAGGFVGSISTVSERCGLSRGQAERAIQVFKKSGMIETQAGHKHTLYLIVNYGAYQSTETQAASESRRQQDASETQAGCKRDASETQARSNKKKEVRSKPEDAAVAASLTAAASRDLTAEEWAEPDPTEVAYALVDRLIVNHPKPGNPEMAKAAASRILAGAVNMAGVVADIERNHAAWCKYWERDRKAFKPMLHRWFSDGDYRHAPVQRELTAKEQGW